MATRANGDRLTPEMMPTIRAAAGDCGAALSVTISRDKSGTYTSNRGDPVDVSMHSEATITADLLVDEYDIDSYASETSSMTWSYTLTATETGDGCTSVERAEGGGTYSGDGGPTLVFGLKSTDGTLFGTIADEDGYMISAAPPTADVSEGDPSAYYHVFSDVCGVPLIDAWWPYTTLAIASGDVPEDGGSLSGSSQRTYPDQFALDRLPITETVTWRVDW